MYARGSSRSLAPVAPAPTASTTVSLPPSSSRCCLATAWPSRHRRHQHSLPLAPNRSTALRSSPSSPHGLPWSPVRYLSESMEVVSRSTSTGTELPLAPRTNLGRGGRKRGGERLFLDSISSSRSQPVGHLQRHADDEEERRAAAPRWRWWSVGKWWLRLCLRERREGLGLGAQRATAGATYIYSGGHGASRPPGQPGPSSVMP
jgi:hypothetical protein